MAAYKSPPRDSEMHSSSGEDDQSFVRKALEKYELDYAKEQSNVTLAYEDLEFRAGEQWPSNIKREREADYRPALTINKIPTFVRSVTGQMRQQRPAIRVVPIDSRGDPKTAEVLGGLVRYIENRSDAQHAYNAGADSQVVAGIGHWRVLTEYADDSTFDQEIRICAVDDGVSVIWDSDAILPNKEDAACCFVPVDISHAAFKEKYPDAPLEDFALTSTTSLDDWYSGDHVRVAEYWERRPEKRTLCLLPDGSIDDVTDQPKRLAQHKAQGYRIEERDSHRVYRSVITSCHLLEKPKAWPGRFIPIVPVIGEEVVIGRRTIRHGIVRYLKDPQRAYNYFRSAETEAVALQPKAPWLVTEKHVENYEDQWLTANTRNYPYLIYKPDPKADGPPQRIPSGMDTSGMVEGLQLAAEEMKAVTGIYDASLGQRSNETSGKAIAARGKESDVGTFVYADNFARAIRHTGRIVLDLVPNIYDAQRTIRIVGEDGKVDLVNINQRTMMALDGLERTMNDVTVAAYDVQLDQGPSYATKREEAREGMMTFLQQAPDAAPAVIDLIANAQDWPNASKFEKRLRLLLPPKIQEMEAQESGEPMPRPEPPQPDPELIMKKMEMEADHRKAAMEMELQQAKAQADMQIAEMGLREKQIEFEIKKMELAAAQVAAEGRIQELQTQAQVAALNGSGPQQ